MLSQPMPWDLAVSSARQWCSSSLVMVAQSLPASRRALTKSHCEMIGVYIASEGLIGYNLVGT